MEDKKALLLRANMHRANAMRIESIAKRKYAASMEVVQRLRDEARRLAREAEDL